MIAVRQAEAKNSCLCRTLVNIRLNDRCPQRKRRFLNSRKMTLAKINKSRFFLQSVRNTHEETKGGQVFEKLDLSLAWMVPDEQHHNFGTRVRAIGREARNRIVCYSDPIESFGSLFENQFNVCIRRSQREILGFQPRMFKDFGKSAFLDLRPCGPLIFHVIEVL
jgi:hypothetical protein